MASRDSDCSGEEDSRFTVPMPDDTYSWHDNEPGPGTLFSRRRTRARAGDEQATEPTEHESANTFTCLCQRCKDWTGMRYCEKRCCFQVPDIRNIMRDVGLPNACFTEHPDFNVMAFNETSLLTHRVTFDRTDRKAYINNLPEYKRNRFVAYSIMIRWVYKRLGTGIREPLPACVVRSIRDGHPDPSGRDRPVPFTYADEGDADADDEEEM